MSAHRGSAPAPVAPRLNRTRTAAVLGDLDSMPVLTAGIVIRPARHRSPRSASFYPVPWLTEHPRADSPPRTDALDLLIPAAPGELATQWPSPGGHAQQSPKHSTSAAPSARGANSEQNFLATRRQASLAGRFRSATPSHRPLMSSSSTSAMPHRLTGARDRSAPGEHSRISNHNPTALV